MIAMKRLGSWLLLGTLVLAVIGCDETTTASRPPEADRPEATSETASSGEAALLLENLNTRLIPSHRCTDEPDLAASYEERIRNRDTAACRFSNGSPLVVYVVRNGQKTYERHFAYQRGPSYFLHGPTWVVIADLMTPREALDVLRDDLGATG